MPESVVVDVIFFQLHIMMWECQIHHCLAQPSTSTRPFFSFEAATHRSQTEALMGQILLKGVEIGPSPNQHTSSATSHPHTPANFHYYRRLPFELKLMVWEHVFEPRDVKIWGQWIHDYGPQSHSAAVSRYANRSLASSPAALSVDRQTRAIAFRYYRPTRSQ